MQTQANACAVGSAESATHSRGRSVGYCCQAVNHRDSLLSPLQGLARLACKKTRGAPFTDSLQCVTERVHGCLA